MTTSQSVHRVKVDWDGDGNFAHPLADIANDLVRPLSALRGRDYGSQIYSESIAGKLVAHLRNADGKYNNLSRQSVLQGLVLPRRKVTFGTPVVESFSGVVIRATITSLSGNDYLSWDSAAGAIPGNDLEIQTGLTAAQGSWQSSVFEIQRGSAELVSMAAAFAAVELSGKSLYVVVGERTAEIPSGLRYATGGDDERQQWMVPNSAPWAIVRDVLDSVGEGDEFEVLIAAPGGFTAHLAPLWTGYVSTVVPIEYPGGNDEVVLTAQGIMSELTGRRIAAQLEENIRCDTAARIVLQTAGIPDVAIGKLDAPRRIDRWWSGHRPAILILREIEETEGGILFEDADGRIRLDRAYARIMGQRRHERAMFSDNGTPGSIGVSDLKFRDAVEGLSNIVRVIVRRYAAGTETILWEIDEPIQLNSGDSTTLIASYSEGAASWTTPLVSGTDYVANIGEDGSGNDATADLGVETEERGSELRIILTNNHASNALYVTTLAPRGQPLAEGQPLIVEERDEASIAKYGERDYLVASSYLGTYKDARDYARYILSLTSEPQRRGTLSFYANQNETLARTLNLGDRVSLIARGDATSMFVESIEHIWNRGNIHIVVLRLSPAQVYASTITLDVGPGLGHGILGR